ncbi:O-antigen ligase family protein, partial [Candidatus Gracilibacteria bacterium]|nr:O-antigen ligase family protein [Candidatus Gracilibacteria bacterium]
MIWYLIGHLFRKYTIFYRFTIFMSILVLLIVGAMYTVDPNKFLSLSSRFVLMSESLSAMLHSPISLLFGFGPDSLLSYFAQHRSDIINSYFPQNMFIDSSHSIFIDILFQYGMFPLWLFGYFLYKNSEKLYTPVGIALIITLVFLILNVFVITHIVILLLLVFMLISQSESINKKSK